MYISIKPWIVQKKRGQNNCCQVKNSLILLKSSKIFFVFCFQKRFSHHHTRDHPHSTQTKHPGMNISQENYVARRIGVESFFNPSLNWDVLCLLEDRVITTTTTSSLFPYRRPFSSNNLHFIMILFRALRWYLRWFKGF